MRAQERYWRNEAAKEGWEHGVRLTACGGKEAAWVSAVPSRPQYRLKSRQWRTAIAMRLGMPQAFLQGEHRPSSCSCHAAFSRRSGAIARGDASAQRPAARRRARHPPPPVDIIGEHDQRRKVAFPLGRHNRVQVHTKVELEKAGKFVRKASVRDLRRDRYDRSQAQADIVVENMTEDGVPVLVDFGVTHSTLLSYVRAAALRGDIDAEGASKRGYAANKYATKKNRRYHDIIKEKGLDLSYQSFIVETFGAFATDTWKFINTVCDPNTHPKADLEHNPWNRPGPLRQFILSTAFANQRGNANMLLQANARRRVQRANHRHATA